MSLSPKKINSQNFIEENFSLASNNNNNINTEIKKNKPKRFLEEENIFSQIRKEKLNFEKNFKNDNINMNKSYAVPLKNTSAIFLKSKSNSGFNKTFNNDNENDSQKINSEYNDLKGERNISMTNDFYLNNKKYSLNNQMRPINLNLKNSKINMCLNNSSNSLDNNNNENNEILNNVLLQEILVRVSMLKFLL